MCGAFRKSVQRSSTCGMSRTRSCPDSVHGHKKFDSLTDGDSLSGGQRGDNGEHKEIKTPEIRPYLHIDLSPFDRGLVCHRLVYTRRRHLVSAHHNVLSFMEEDKKCEVTDEMEEMMIEFTEFQKKSEKKLSICQPRTLELHIWSCRTQNNRFFCPSKHLQKWS